MTRVVAPACLATALAIAIGAGATEPVLERERNYELAWVWALSGPCCGDSGEHMRFDENGDVLVFGHYGKLDLDNDGRPERNSFGSSDAMLFKAEAGGRLRWLQGAGGPEYDTARGMAAAPDGGSYIGGSFQRQGIFPPGSMIASKGPSDGFLARMNADGKTLWARAVGGVGDDSVMGVAGDAEGNAYIVANVRGAVDLDNNGRADVETAGEVGTLIASYTQEGKLRWSRVVKTRGKAYAHGAASVADGGIYIAASHREAPLDVDGDGKDDLPPAPAEGNSYIARFDADGSLAWVRPVKSTQGAGIRALATFTGGDLLAVGAFNGELDLDGDGRADTVLPEGDISIATWVARFAPDGTLRWARTYGAAHIWHASANEDHVLLSGLYKRSLDFDRDGIPDGRADEDGESEGLIVMLDGEGEVLRIMTIVGPSGDQARASAFLPDGKAIMVTGFVRLTADFDDDGEPEGGVRCDHRGDVFLARYDLLESGSDPSKLLE